MTAAAAAILIVYGIGLAGFYDLEYAAEILPSLLKGLVGTMTLVAVVIPVGFILGFMFGWGRTSHNIIVRGISAWYVEFFRGMPPIVLIAFSYLITIVLLQGSTRIDATQFAPIVAIFALAGHSGAYQAEITRAGILSVPVGQREAAQAIGMTKGEIMLYITLPQMLRVSLPALGNEFASVIKDTSLLSAVGILELTFVGFNLSYELLFGRRSLDLYFVIFVEIAVLYFVLTFIVSRLLQSLERRYRVPGLEAAQL